MSNATKIKLHDRTFRPAISAAELDVAIERVAARIDADYAERANRAGNEPPLFLGVLNGAFMFAAELAKKLSFPLEVSFVKLSSYSGTASTGAPRELIGLAKSIEGRHIIIVEDIVDTGESMGHLLRELEKHRPASVEIATLFFKPGAYRKDFPVKYRAMEIDNEFIVGFGLDYNELGRNLKDIYVVTDDE